MCWEDSNIWRLSQLELLESSLHLWDVSTRSHRPSGSRAASPLTYLLGMTQGKCPHRANRNYVIVYELALWVTQHPFCHILLSVTVTKPIQFKENWFRWGCHGEVSILHCKKRVCGLWYILIWMFWKIQFATRYTHYLARWPPVDTSMCSRNPGVL